MGPGGLKRRLAHHHLHLSPKAHWHIDYLKAHATVKQIWLLPQAQPDEHNIAAALCVLGSQPLARFGASDCHCHSHLFGFRRMVALSLFRSGFSAPEGNNVEIQAIAQVNHLVDAR